MWSWFAYTWKGARRGGEREKAGKLGNISPKWTNLGEYLHSAFWFWMTLYNAMWCNFKLARRHFNFKESVLYKVKLGGNRNFANLKILLFFSEFTKKKTVSKDGFLFFVERRRRRKKKKGGKKCKKSFLLFFHFFFFLFPCPSFYCQKIKRNDFMTLREECGKAPRYLKFVFDVIISARGYHLTAF